MPRCKNCKEKFEAKYFNQKFCLEKDECIKALSDHARQETEKREMKAWKKRKTEMKINVYTSEMKSTLQKEINKLARMIDNRFNLPCIDCDRPFGNQQDGGHFKSVGSNATLRFNLHNIHSQRSECNQNGLGGGKERQYYDGLIRRYGIYYAEMVDVGLQQKYKTLHLTNKEIYEKTEIVRKLIRDFDTFMFEDPKEAREKLNKIIGIYN